MNPKNPVTVRIVSTAIEAPVLVSLAFQRVAVRRSGCAPMAILRQTGSSGWQASVSVASGRAPSPRRARR